LVYLRFLLPREGSGLIDGTLVGTSPASLGLIQTLFGLLEVRRPVCHDVLLLPASYRTFLTRSSGRVLARLSLGPSVVPILGSGLLRLSLLSSELAMVRGSIAPRSPP